MLKRPLGRLGTLSLSRRPLGALGALSMSKRPLGWLGANGCAWLNQSLREAVLADSLDWSVDKVPMAQVRSATALVARR